MSGQSFNVAEFLRNWRNPKNAVGNAGIIGVVLYLAGAVTTTSWLTITGLLIVVVSAPLFFVLRRRERDANPMMNIDPTSFERVGGAGRQPAIVGLKAPSEVKGPLSVMDLIIPGGPWTVDDVATALRLETERRRALLTPDTDSSDRIPGMDAAEALRQAILSGATPATWQVQIRDGKVAFESGGMYSVEDGKGRFVIAKIVELDDDAINLHYFPELFSSRPIISETGAFIGERVVEENERHEVLIVPVSRAACAKWSPQLIGRQPVTADELAAVQMFRDEQGD